jgi:ABC-type multidrug transport system fused ATPase/permease subunit
MRLNPPVTRWHLIELTLNGANIFLHLLEFIFAIKTSSPVFLKLGAVFMGLAWAASLSMTYHEYRRGTAHTWPLITWLVSAFVAQSLKLQVLKYNVSHSSPEFIISVLHFICYGILGCASFAYNVAPPDSIRDVFTDLMGNEVSNSTEQDLRTIPLDSMNGDSVGDDGNKKNETSTEIVYGAYPASPYSPEENSGTVGAMFFSWLNPLLDLSSKRPLEAPDLPQLSKVDETSRLTDALEQAWLEQVKSHDPSFFKALVKTFGRQFAIAGLFKMVNDGLIFVGPIILGLLITFIQTPSEPLWHGLMYAAIMGFASVIQSLFIHMYFFRVFRVGQQIRASIAGLVYRKAFTMSFDSRKKYTVGEMVNHQSVDTSRLDGTMPYLHMIWSGPIQIVVSLALLYRIVGVSVFAGLLILILMIPINLQISRVLSVIQKQMMGFKDARNKIVNEVLQGIRVIKYFAWEKSFEEKVEAARKVEIDALQQGAKIKAYTAFIWVASPVIVSLATFGVFTFLGHILTPEIAFPALALINILRFPINALPNVISSVVDSQVSIGRLQAYFLCYDLDVRAVEQDLNEPCAVKIENADFEWVMYRPLLENLNISIPRGALVAIVGEVGSGKSSILATLLGEIPKITGRVIVNGRVAYCPQQAWIQNTTVKNNIVFGAEYNPELYQNVIDVCELRSDLAILQAGDETEIGEKGINLSGGQKQRVSLARSVYQNADIYLLDDPLSAVDAHVGKALFENTIVRHLHGKTRILVTHQLQYMSKVDQIIVISNGKVTEKGTYEQLMNDNGEFAKLIVNHVHDKEENEQHIGSSNSSSSLSGDMEEDHCLLDEVEMKTELQDPSGLTNAVSTTTALDSPRSMSSSEIEETLVELNPELVDEAERTGKTIAEVRMSRDGSKLSPKSTSLEIARNSSQTSQNDSKKKDGGEGKLMTTEERSTGSVDSSVYITYAKAIGGVLMTSSILLFFILDSGSKIASDWWLNIWSAAAELSPPPHSMRYYLALYAVIALSNSVAILIRSFLLIIGAMKAAVTIHQNMLHAVMRSPVSWFDTVPLGRILNRFAKDQYAADESLMRTLSMALSTLFGVISIAIVVGAVTPWILVYVLPLAFLYRYIQQYYLNSSRELQRLNSISRSPVFALFGESLSGLSTIRGYGKVSDFIRLNEEKIDENQKAHFLSTTANRWLGLRLEFVGTCVVFGAALFAVLSRSSLAAGLVGLSITYALQLTSQLNWMVRMSTDVENELVAVERCVQYTKLEPEADLIVEPRPPAAWPQDGSIFFSNLSLRYREGLPLVLRGITCKIKAREKIGVVGRTGAGKSSLMNALFRMTEAASGSIHIDGLNIANIGLEDLRSRLAIIPQDPTLFAGTIRSNLDPFNLYSDSALWSALGNVYLKDQVDSMGKGLESQVTEFGENLSVGSRQLMCLARALLRNPRILVMDEATASIDYKSDEKIQRTIREQFQNATVLTIAHRIATIADSDRVMVLDFGQLIEFDTPERLLQNPNSIFSALSKKSKQSRKEAQDAASSRA